MLEIEWETFQKLTENLKEISEEFGEIFEIIIRNFVFSAVLRTRHGVPVIFKNDKTGYHRILLAGVFKTFSNFEVTFSFPTIESFFFFFFF